MAKPHKNLIISIQRILSFSNYKNNYLINFLDILDITLFKYKNFGKKYNYFNMSGK